MQLSDEENKVYLEEKARDVPLLGQLNAPKEIAEDNIKSMDLLLNCAVIAMKQYKPELATKEQLEELIDLPTVYKVIEVAAGIQLNDPNALAAALVGTN